MGISVETNIASVGRSLYLPNLAVNRLWLDYAARVLRASTAGCTTAWTVWGAMYQKAD